MVKVGSKLNIGKSILMSYSGRTRYKTRREKNQLARKRARAVIVFAFIALLALAFKNRIVIRDYIIATIN